MSQSSSSQESNCNSAATSITDDLVSSESFQVTSQSSLSTIEPSFSPESITTTYTQSSYSDHTSDDEFINDRTLDSIQSTLSSLEYLSSCCSQSTYVSSFSDASTVPTTQSDTTTDDTSFFSSFSSSQSPLGCSVFCHFHTKSSTQN